MAVNILSPIRVHVRIGNNIIPVAEPINLEVQTDPVDSVVTFHAYQKNIEHGTPKTTAETSGLFFHQSLRS